MWFKFLPSLQGLCKGPCHTFSGTISSACVLREAKSADTTVVTAVTLLSWRRRRSHCVFIFSGFIHKFLVTVSSIYKCDVHSYKSEAVETGVGGGLGSFLLVRLTSEVWSRVQSDLLPTCSKALELSLCNQIHTDAGSNEPCFPRAVSPHWVRLSCASFFCMLRRLGNSRSWVTFANFLLSKSYISCQWLPGLSSADKASQTGQQSERIEALWPSCLHTLLCTYCPIGGAMTSYSSCSLSSAAQTHPPPFANCLQCCSQKQLQVYPWPWPCEYIRNRKKKSDQAWYMLHSDMAGQTGSNVQ